MTNNMQNNQIPTIVCNNTACKYRKEGSCTAETVNIVIGRTGDFATPVCITFERKEQRPRSNWGY